ncbi:MAG: amino acid permease [Acidobacteria bacterium]|nr:amino acid permease [Acidobacteriota bacterium]
MTDDGRGKTGLVRELGLVGLTATGICSMLGAGINVVPFMLQRNVPDIGPWVLPAFLVGAIPALIAALAYAVLASAMPRAGGSYIHVSRGLNPYLGFIASFSQWFGLSIVVGVVTYVMVPFMRDVAEAVGYTNIAAALETGPIRVGLALFFIWAFVAVNIRCVQFYERMLIPLMIVMFALGSVVIFAGFSFDQETYLRALEATGATIPAMDPAPFQWSVFLSASVVLFASFIGFDSIAQAGGEARNPGRALPAAIGLTMLTVGSFYMLFTAAVYNTVPWQYVAQEAMLRDVTAPGLLGVVLSPGWTVAIVGGAAIALLNDVPAMLLSLSRLMFAWAEDGIFPRALATVHPKHHTPHVAIIASGVMASMGVLGSHLAGDFFLGVDIMVTSMLVNFALMCVTVVTLPRRNPEIASRIEVFRGRLREPLAAFGAVVLVVFLGIHTWKDLNADVDAWYFHSTPVWLIVMAVGSLIYFRERAVLARSGVDVDERFNNLPPE